METLQILQEMRTVVQKKLNTGMKKRKLTDYEKECLVQSYDYYMNFFIAFMPFVNHYAKDSMSYGPEWVNKSFPFLAELGEKEIREIKILCAKGMRSAFEKEKKKIMYSFLLEKEYKMQRLGNILKSNNLSKNEIVLYDEKAEYFLVHAISYVHDMIDSVVRGRSFAKGDEKRIEMIKQAYRFGFHRLLTTEAKMQLFSWYKHQFQLGVDMAVLQEEYETYQVCFFEDYFQTKIPMRMVEKRLLEPIQFYQEISSLLKNEDVFNFYLETELGKLKSGVFSEELGRQVLDALGTIA